MRDKYYSEGIVLIVLVHVCRWVVGVVFIAAGVPKILDAESFMRVVANYNILPLFLVPVIALVLPWLELFCGVALLMNKFMQSASSILSALILLFIGGISVNFMRGADFDCGCFGILFQSGSAGVMTIIRDIFLFGLTAFVFIISYRRMPVFKNEE
jgi:hypothetical protein